MKKFLLALTLMVPMILVGCSESLENRARNQLAETTKEVQSGGMSVENVSVAYRSPSDSLIILKYDMRSLADKTLHGHNLRYIYYIQQDAIREAITAKAIEDVSNFEEFGMSEGKAKDVVISLTASLIIADRGREVP